MWNEEYMLPYFLRYYSTFADKIFIIDDHSTDRTVEIAQANPKVQMLDFPYNKGLDETNFSDCYEDYYKHYSRGVADWVMCPDADEIIYNKNILAVLREQRQRGVQALQCTAYHMVSKDQPQTDGQIYEVCQMGTRARPYDKTLTFDPAIDARFGIGRHTLQVPEGVRISKAKLLMLHYRYLSRDSIIDRANESYPRWSGMDEKQASYRIKRALDWYDKAIATGEGLEKVV
jgi:glycosyltransferase involved in cell wall biosynthesis